MLQAVGGDVVGDVEIAGGADLHADVVGVVGIEDVVHRGDLAALGHDDALHRGGVGRGEIDALFAILGDGEAGHSEVDLAADHGGDNGVELHVHDLQIAAQLLGDGLGDFHVDADDLAGLVVVILIRGEVDAGAHRQRFGHRRSTEHEREDQNQSKRFFHGGDLLSV